MYRKMKQTTHIDMSHIIVYARKFFVDVRVSNQDERFFINNIAVCLATGDSPQRV